MNSINYNIEVLEACNWWEITDYMNLTKEEVYIALNQIKENGVHCTRILYKGKVVVFIQTNQEQIDWLINQDLDKLCSNRILKYMENNDSYKKRR